MMPTHFNCATSMSMRPRCFETHLFEIFLVALQRTISVGRRLWVPWSAVVVGKRFCSFCCGCLTCLFASDGFDMVWPSVISLTRKDECILKKIAAILMGIVMIDRYQASGQLFQGFLRLLGALTMQVSPTEYNVNMLSFVYTHTPYIHIQILSHDCYFTWNPSNDFFFHDLPFQS